MSLVGNTQIILSDNYHHYDHQCQRHHTSITHSLRSYQCLKVITHSIFHTIIHMLKVQ